MVSKICDKLCDNLHCNIIFLLLMSIGEINKIKSSYMILYATTNTITCLKQRNQTSQGLRICPTAQSRALLKEKLF